MRVSLHELDRSTAPVRSHRARLVAGLLATISAIWIVVCAATDGVAGETGAHAPKTLMPKQHVIVPPIRGV
jgi:hypothetical protein